MLTPNNARGEHLLWLSLMLYIWLASFIAPVQTLVVFWDTNYYFLTYLETCLIFLATAVIPYLLHKHFRDNKTRNIGISWMHILSSVLLMLTILMIYTYTPPINRESRYAPILLPSFQRWVFLNNFAIVLFASFVLVQVVFTIYGLNKLIKQKLGISNHKRNRIEQYSFEDVQTNQNPALIFK